MTVDTTVKAQTRTELRPGWRVVRFGDVVRDVKVTVDAEESGLERYIAGEHMDTDDLHIRRWGTIGDGYLGPAFHRKFVAGQVLYGSRRTYLRKVAVADFDGICANTTFVLEPLNDDLIPELLPFVMQTEGFVKHSMQQSRGSTNPYVTFKDLAWYEFALPPRDEQRRIAEILWAADEVAQTWLEATKALDEGKEITANNLLSFDTTSTQRDGRSAQPFREISIDDLRISNEPVLKTGPFGSSLKSEYFSDKGVPIINISALGEVSIEEKGLLYLAEEHASKFRAYEVQKDDIVFSRVADVGRCILISEDCTGWIISSNLIRIRLDPAKILPLYFLYLLKFSPYIKNQIRGITATGGRLLVNTQTLRELKIPLPDKELQATICQIISALESRTSGLEAHAQRVLQMLQSLREALISSTTGEIQHVQ